VNRKTNKKPKQKPNEIGVGKKLSPAPAPARVNCKHAPSSRTSLCSRRPPKPPISNDLHYREVRVMKDPAEEDISDSKEDIKNAQPEKFVGDTPEKPLPNIDVLCSLLPRKPIEKSTRKN
jgi:hypothetical protein